MNTTPDNKILTGIWKDGQILLDAPADWPEGCKLKVFPIGGPGESIGSPDDQWPSDPQGIAALLERMDQIEPFEMTPEEEADWLAWRRKCKDYELTNFDKRVEGLFE